MRSRQAKKNLGKDFDTLTSEIKEKTIRTLLKCFHEGKLGKNERLLFKELVRSLGDEDLVKYVNALETDAHLINKW